MNARLLQAARAAAAIVAVVALGGCVSVFPKSDPAQLYTFGRGGGQVADAAAAPLPNGRTGVLLAGVNFPRAAQGDTILTMTGSQAAYIDKSRWVAPAVVLFREAVERRFETAQRTRLVSRGDLGRSSLILRLDVREFEADYAAPGAVPEAAVSLYARISRADGTLLDERLFRVRRPASDNRVGAIVDGLDRATAEILDGVVTWADAAAAQTPASSPS